MMKKENEKEPGFLLVIDASGNEKELFNTIASALIPFVEGKPINLIPLKTDLGKAVIENFEPFYIGM